MSEYCVTWKWADEHSLRHDADYATKEEAERALDLLILASRCYRKSFDITPSIAECEVPCQDHPDDCQPGATTRPSTKQQDM